jgi:hypothetical protein
MGVSCGSIRSYAVFLFSLPYHLQGQVVAHFPVRGCGGDCGILTRRRRVAPLTGPGPPILGKPGTGDLGTDGTFPGRSVPKFGGRSSRPALASFCKGTTKPYSAQRGLERRTQPLFPTDDHRRYGKVRVLKEHHIVNDGGPAPLVYFYRVGYVPTRPETGECRKVKVTVDQPHAAVYANDHYCYLRGWRLRRPRRRILRRNMCH